MLIKLALDKRQLAQDTNKALGITSLQIETEKGNRALEILLRTTKV